MTNIAEHTGKVAAIAVDAMRSVPLAIALLVVNIGFLSFAAYILGEVASNASERNKAQLELIGNLVRDIRDCRQPASSPTRWDVPIRTSPPTP
jgi:Tfp pilus assembly protein PilV